MPINLLPSLFWCLVSTSLSYYLIVKEDIKYKLTNIQLIICYIVAILFSTTLSFLYAEAEFLIILSIVGTISALCPSIIIDFKYKELPNRATLVSFLFSLITYYFLYNNGLFVFANIYSVIIGFIILFIILFTGNLGGGDVKMSVGLMIILQAISPISLLMAFEYSLLTAIVYIIFYKIHQKIKNPKLIPEKRPDGCLPEPFLVNLKTEGPLFTIHADIDNIEEFKEDIDTIIKNKKKKELFAFGPFLILGTMIAFIISAL